ncbi:MAG: polyprenyl synthetase family protein [SAR86 cluster bacterium]|nr:polyprenyl synthetase family protein [SAR86 cluster bacterium]HIC27552.1 polyprenyl synthetase family protein [Gammaproteobacteria bacterium]
MNIDPHKHIKPELEELETFLKESISSDIELATEVSSYIVQSGGKRIRPTITILIARALNYQGNELTKLATAIELLHTATLIHDDVVDQSELRRGKISIHKKWNNAHGVLVGDFVYSKAFQLMASLKNKQIIQTLADSTNRISEGEVMQLNFLESKSIKEEDYFEIIGRKTAELFKACAHTAALIAEAEENLVKTSCEFAYALGIVFQLTDDLLDYYGDELRTGKKIGKDFLEGKITLPLIKAYDLANTDDLRLLKRAFETRDEGKLYEVINIISRSGAVKEVEKVTNEYSEKCLNLLDKFQDSIYKESLRAVVTNLKERSK